MSARSSSIDDPLVRQSAVDKLTEGTAKSLVAVNERLDALDVNSRMNREAAERLERGVRTLRGEHGGVLASFHRLGKVVEAQLDAQNEQLRRHVAVEFERRTLRGRWRRFVAWIGGDR